MRTRLLTVLTGCLLLLPSHVSAQTDETAVLRGLIAKHQLASEHGDLRGLVDIYAVDAETISATGRISKGRDAIEADYKNTLAAASTKTGRHHTHPVDSIAIEFITADVALIEVDSVNVGGTDSSGTAMADARSKLITIWRKRAGEWLVAYQRALPAPAK